MRKARTSHLARCFSVLNREIDITWDQMLNQLCQLALSTASDSSEYISHTSSKAHFYCVKIHYSLHYMKTLVGDFLRPARSMVHFFFLSPAILTLTMINVEPMINCTALHQCLHQCSDVRWVGWGEVMLLWKFYLHVIYYD